MTALAAPFISFVNVAYHYRLAGKIVWSLEDLSFNLAPGQATVLKGQSGSGKTTLLHLAGLLDAPAAGKIVIEGFNSLCWTDKEAAMWRRQNVGFVYQSHHLLPELSVEENVAFPQVLLGFSWSEARRSARKLLKKIGLEEWAAHKPSQLSGGQQQRAAVARALIHKPKLLIADEPTGSLDEKNGRLVIQLMQELLLDMGASLFVATHSADLFSWCDQHLTLKEGKLLPEKR